MSPITESAARTTRRKRGEIEGLRTVAALLVAAYHVWFGRVSGGVDVFFVVTGFFITLTLLGHVRRTGTIRPLAYLGRLARRVWPMAAIVLGFAIILTTTLAPGALRDRNFSEILASALYGENWYLAFNAIDYLNAEDPATPVQHFWALSLQGQFYLVWLALALVAVAFARLLKKKYTAVLAVMIAAVLVVSFAWAIQHTSVAQPFAYFNTSARLWEFSVGGLLALAGRRVLVKGAWAGIASWVGLIGLIACGFVVPVEAAFPGWPALWPVICAALLIVATRTSESRWSATRLLASRPLVWAGSFAFGIYLWHWPLFVAWRYVNGLESQPSILDGVGIIAAAVIAAWLCHLVVERPVALVGQGSFALTLALVLVWASIVGTSVLATTSDDHDATPPSTVTGQCYGAGAIINQADCDVHGADATLVPERQNLLEDTGGAYRCYTAADAANITRCNTTDGSMRVALIGNSHAAMFGPALQERAEELGWSLDILASNGCVWGPQSSRTLDLSVNCATRLAEQEQLLLHGDPYDLVLYAGGRGNTAATDQQINVIAENWERLRAHGSTIAVVEDNPRLSQEEVACVLTLEDAELLAGACDATEAEAMSIPDRYVAAAEQIGAEVLRTSDLYCAGGRCPAVIGNVIVYRDAHHITSTFTETTIAELLNRLEAMLKRGT